MLNCCPNICFNQTSAASRKRFGLHTSTQVDRMVPYISTNCSSNASYVFTFGIAQFLQLRCKQKREHCDGGHFVQVIDKVEPNPQTHLRS